MRSERVVILGVSVIVALVLGAACTGAASAASVVYSWGRNRSAVLGDGIEESAAPFSAVPGLIAGLSQVTAIAGGENHNLALESGGTVEAWGENADGQLGTGNTTSSDIPVPVSGLTEVTAVAAGKNHSLALLSNGTVEAWGANTEGQLGTGNTTSSDIPVPVSGLTEVTAIAADSNSSYALLRDGTVMAWGRNHSGQLGDGTVVQKDTPVAVSELTGVSAIAAGDEFALALLGNGEARAWGSDSHGQLGDSRVDEEPTDRPVAVHELDEARELAAGRADSLALLATGKVVAWGEDKWGELGGGEAGEGIYSSTPVAVHDLSGVKAIAAGGFHDLALLEGDTVMAWGGDEWGELGNGLSGKVGTKGVLSDLPVAVSCGLKGASAVAAGYWTSFAYGEITGDECPIITDVTPDEGPSSGGTTVTIKGTNLEGVSAVGFGETPALSFTVKSDSEIEAVSPPGLVSPSIKVTNAAGASAPDSATLFNYITTVLKVKPAYGPSAGGVEVQIEGVSLNKVTGVNFGSTPAESFEVVNSNLIRAIVPPGSGSATVTVTTASGLGEANPEATFAYLTGPEFGRCLKEERFGEFLGSDCTTVTSSDKKFQWYPASLGEQQLKKRGFTLTGGNVALETKGRTRIACTGDTGAGEITGDRSVTLSLTLSNCQQNATVACHSAGAAEGDVSLGPLVGELGVTRAAVSPLKSQVGLRIAASSGETLAEFSCGETPVTLRGSLILEARSTNKMRTTFSWSAKQSKGKQKVTHFEGEAEGGIQAKIGSSEYERAGLAASISQINEEELELDTLI
jgi:alpha-tubulin suppressor-like RCC1 family protein